MSNIQVAPEGVFEHFSIHIEYIEKRKKVMKGYIIVQGIEASKLQIDLDDEGRVRVGVTNPKPFTTQEVSVISLMCQSYWAGVFDKASFIMPTIRQDRTKVLPKPVKLEVQEPDKGFICCGGIRHECDESCSCGEKCIRPGDQCGSGCYQLTVN